MTCDEIIRMAREAAARHGHTLKEQPSPETVEFITELAAIVAAAEREACAQLAAQTVCDTHLPTGIKIYGAAAAKAISTRGKK